MNAMPSSPVVPAKRAGWKLFSLGLGVRLVGVGLLWLGDGHDSLFHKALVVLGVILSIGGIGVLRYMLFADLFSRRGKTGSAARSPHNPPMQRTGGDGAF